MHFIDAERFFVQVALGPRVHPIAVIPLVALEVVNHRGGFFPPLAEKSERVGLQQKCALLRPNLEFVMGALLHAGQKQFPNAAPEQAPHRVHPAVPPIEVADHADALSVRRPDGEISAFDVADLPEMRAELFVKLEMISLGEQMEIDLAHDEAVAVGIADDSGGSIPFREVNAIIGVTFHSGQGGLEKTFATELLGWEALLSRPRDD